MLPMYFLAIKILKIVCCLLVLSLFIYLCYYIYNKILDVMKNKSPSTETPK